MEQLGNEFNTTGSIMSRTELEESRRKRGECVTCGRKCFQKKLFKMIPITDHGRVLNGRCLNCRPLEARDGVLPAATRPATLEDLQRFTRSQSNLQVTQNGGGGPSRRSTTIQSSASAAQTSQAVERAPVRRSGSRGNTPSRSQSMIQVQSPPPPAVPAEPRPMPPRSASLHMTAVVLQSGGGGSATSLMSANTATAASAASIDGSSRSVSGQGGGRKVRSASITGSSPTPQIFNQPNQFRSTQSFWPGADIESSRNEMSVSGHSVSSRGSSTSSSPFNDGPEIAPGSTSLGVPFGMITSQRLNDFESQRDITSLDEVASLPTISNRQVGGNVNSSRSLQSNEDIYSLPIRQGVLDRGGQFTFGNNLCLPNGSNLDLPAQVNPFGSIRGESNRTLSSMSSIEEDAVMSSSQGGRRFKQPPDTVAGLFDDDASECSAPSMHSVRSGTTVSTRTPGADRILGNTERMGLERLRRAGTNYAEIVCTMRENTTSSFLQQEALKDLSNLYLSESDQNAMADLGALELIVSSMRAHPNEVELQICGCRAIWNVSATSVNQIRLVAAGAVEALLTSMEEFLEEPEVQEKAMAALSNLGAAEANLPVIIEKGSVGRIVEAMNRHSEDARVQVKGCTAIINLASHDSPVKRRILEGGAGGAVVVSMVMHPEHSDLQEKALRAIRNLCANNDENKVDLANIGGIDAVISAMQVHRDEPGVQEAGAWALSNLALDPGNRVVIGDSGGVDVVIRAMWVHSDHPGVQEWCCRALWTLAGDHQNRAMIMEVGGISAVINAMQAHVDEGAVQEKGCAVLDALASDTDSKLRIVNEEALDAIVLAMVLHSEDSMVQQRALSVLCRLAIKENMKPMQAANADELAKVAAEKFPDLCQDVASQLLGALEAHA